MENLGFGAACALFLIYGYKVAIYVFGEQRRQGIGPRDVVGLVLIGCLFVSPVTPLAMWALGDPGYIFKQAEWATIAVLSAVGIAAGLFQGSIYRGAYMRALRALEKDDTVLDFDDFDGRDLEDPERVVFKMTFAGLSPWLAACTARYLTARRPDKS